MPRRQSEGTNLGSQTRLWDSYHAKSPNLRHPQARSQNKGLNRASPLQTMPLQLQAASTGSGQSRPQRDIIYQTATRLICQLRLLEVLDGQHPPEKVCQLYSHKTEWEGRGR